MRKEEKKRAHLANLPDNIGLIEVLTDFVDLFAPQLVTSSLVDSITIFAILPLLQELHAQE